VGTSGDREVAPLDHSAVVAGELVLGIEPRELNCVSTVERALKQSVLNGAHGEGQPRSIARMMKDQLLSAAALWLIAIPTAQAVTVSEECAAPSIVAYQTTTADTLRAVSDPSARSVRRGRPGGGGTDQRE
jgi:hypothetical protein